MNNKFLVGVSNLTLLISDYSSCSACSNEMILHSCKDMLMELLSNTHRQRVCEADWAGYTQTGSMLKTWFGTFSRLNLDTMLKCFMSVFKQLCWSLRVKETHLDLKENVFLLLFGNWIIIRSRSKDAVLCRDTPKSTQKRFKGKGKRRKKQSSQCKPSKTSCHDI